MEDDVNTATTDERNEAQEMAFILAIGCHAGTHRLVAIAEAIQKEVASFIKDENLKGNTHHSVVHRDINKKVNVDSSVNSTRRCFHQALCIRA